MVAQRFYSFVKAGSGDTGRLKMKMRFAAPCAMALLLCAPVFMSEVFAQAGTMGTKQMRDVQRKAEHKARSNQAQQHSQQNSTQHHAASAAAPASAP
jgi:hypothetical protein